MASGDPPTKAPAKQPELWKLAVAGAVFLVLGVGFLAAGITVVPLFQMALAMVVAGLLIGWRRRRS